MISFKQIFEEASTINHSDYLNLVMEEEKLSNIVFDSIVWPQLKWESYGFGCKIGKINHISIVTTSELGPTTDEKWPKNENHSFSFIEANLWEATDKKGLCDVARFSFNCKHFYKSLFSEQCSHTPSWFCCSCLRTLLCAKMSVFF